MSHRIHIGTLDLARLAAADLDLTIDRLLDANADRWVFLDDDLIAGAVDRWTPTPPPPLSRARAAAQLRHALDRILREERR